jgi:hypothetical protein
METIYEDKSKNLKITVDNTYDHKFLEFLKNVKYGTNGVVHTVNSIESEFKKTKDPLFISLKENDELVGIRVLNHKKMHQNGIDVDVFYKSLLAIDPAKMNKGYGTLLLNKISAHIFTKYDKVILSAFVEAGNIRSKRAVQKSGHEYINVFSALSHMSLMPKANKNVSKLNKDDESKILSLLNRQYNNRTFFSVNESFDPESYYVLKENNEIKAGLQVKVASWTFLKFPGLYGFFLMKIVPKIPILKKIFNPKNHSFMKIGNIYITDGRSFSQLLDAVLNLYNLNTCMACLNPNSEVDSKIIAEMKKGLLSSEASKMTMFAECKNITIKDLGVTTENCYYPNF